MFMMKCVFCHEEKHRNEFSSRATPVCKPCRKRHTSVVKRAAKYGICVETPYKLLRQQGGGCAICGEKDFDALCIDHDHATGRVRGMLCGKCNFGLGFFRDNVLYLQQAIRYLLKERGLKAEKSGIT